MRPACTRILDAAATAAAASMTSPVARTRPRRRRAEPGSGRRLRDRRRPPSRPDFLRRIGCRKDFDALASEPLDASIPGARSVKVVLDTLDGDALYFQNSKKYQIHYEFASAHLSGNGKPLVGTADEVQPDRVLLARPPLHPGRGHLLRGARALGAGDRALRHGHAGDDRPGLPQGGRGGLLRPGAGLSPHLRGGRAGGGRAAGAACAGAAPPRSTRGRLPAAQPRRQHRPAALRARRRAGRRASTSASATSSCSTTCPTTSRSPGHHHRGVPDPAVARQRAVAEPQDPQHGPAQRLRRPAPARARGQVGALRGGGHRLHASRRSPWPRPTPGGRSTSPGRSTIAAHEHQRHRPARRRRPCSSRRLPLREAIQAAMPRLRRQGHALRGHGPGRPGAHAQPGGFVIPVYYYAQFLEQNGFDEQIDALLADPDFRGDPEVRDAMLAEPAHRDGVGARRPGLRGDAATTSCARSIPDSPMRFRSSTNAEDLEGFPAPASTPRRPATSPTREAPHAAPSRRSGPASGSSGPSRSATTAASTTRRWAWRCWSTPPSPTRRRTASP